MVYGNPIQWEREWSILWGTGSYAGVRVSMIDWGVLLEVKGQPPDPESFQYEVSRQSEDPDWNPGLGVGPSWDEILALKG